MGEQRGVIAEDLHVTLGKDIATGFRRIVAEGCVECVGVDGFCCGKKHARRLILRDGFIPCRVVSRLGDDLAWGQGVDFKAGLHQLLFEIKEDLRETGLFFGEREDGFVDDLKAERGFDAFAVRVRDVKAEVRVGCREDNLRGRHALRYGDPVPAGQR